MKNLIILVLLMVIAYQYINNETSDKPITITPSRVKVAIDEDALPTQDNNPLSPMSAINTIEPFIEETQDEKHDEMQRSVRPRPSDYDVSGAPTRYMRRRQIRSQLCLTTSPTDGCIVDTQLNIQQEIIDAESGHAKSMVIVEVLKSANFDSVLTQFSDIRTKEQAYLREQGFNDSIYDIMAGLDNITTNGVVCGDVACAVSFVYKKEADWNTFRQQFQNSGAHAASTLVTDFITAEGDDLEKRMMLLPKYTVIND